MLRSLDSKGKKMNKSAPISPYLCHVIGERPERAARFHESTIRRTKTFAIAIHIPVLLWVVTSFLIADRVFELNDTTSACIAIGSGSLIYLIERLVLSTPKIFAMNAARLVIGIVIALLGASTVDLVIFEREIHEQLAVSKKGELEERYVDQIESLSREVDSKRSDWKEAHANASCEANGTCGSGVRSVGPIYRALARHAGTLRQDLDSSERALASLKATMKEEMTSLDQSPTLVSSAGLLSRVQALHEYIIGNVWAMVTWSCFFILILSFELMVVFCKMIFPRTVDDEIEEVRESISQEKVRRYQEAISDPTARAMALIDQAY